MLRESPIYFLLGNFNSDLKIILKPFSLIFFKKRNQLEKPGNYDNLISLWEKKSIINLSDFLKEHKSKQDLQSNAGASSIIDKIFNKRLTMYRVRISNKVLFKFKVLYILLFVSNKKQLNSVNQIDYRSYTKFALYFGPSIFCLWKYVLLNKRIVFYSVPPISDLCS